MSPARRASWSRYVIWATVVVNAIYLALLALWTWAVWHADIGVAMQLSGALTGVAMLLATSACIVALLCERRWLRFISAAAGSIGCFVTLYIALDAARTHVAQFRSESPPPYTYVLAGIALWTLFGICLRWFTAPPAASQP